MKPIAIKIIFMTSISFITIDAMACHRSSSQLVCPGDEVTTLSGSEGKITGVNPYRQTAGVRFHTDSYGYRSTVSGVYLISKLSNGEFCTTYGQRYRFGKRNVYMEERLLNYSRVSDLPYEYSYLDETGSSPTQ